MPKPPQPLQLSLRQRFLARAQHALSVTSACNLYVRAFGINGAVILMYHSVARPERRHLQDPQNAMPEAVFAAQLSLLARQRRVISLDTLTQMLAAGESPATGSVVITFDDGYLDTYEVAAPILARHDLPATLFLATGYTERVENAWIDVLFNAFRTRARQRLALPLATFDLSKSEQVDQAYISAAGELIRAGTSKRAELMSSIREQLEPQQQAPRLTMSWDEVRALHRRHPNISIGSHTREHLDMSSLSDEAVVEELSAAHRDIERELGITPVHFAFPYGRDNARARAWLGANGYRSACLTEPMTLVQSHSDPLRLTRLEARQDPTPERFAYHTSGAHPSLSQALFLGRA
jgi:peptidoglycan/xylan/chitin deacetylase (PgdA/CDA1 family)